MEIRLRCERQDCDGSIAFSRRRAGAGMRGECDACDAKYALLGGTVTPLDDGDEVRQDQS